jgi:hypothetical protein
MRCGEVAVLLKILQIYQIKSDAKLLITKFPNFPLHP